MVFRALALAGFVLTGSIAPSLAAPIASHTSDTQANAPILLADGHGDRVISVSVSEAVGQAVERVQVKYIFYDTNSYYSSGQPSTINAAAIRSAVIPALGRAGITSDRVSFSENPVGTYGGAEVSAIVSLPASHTAIGNANGAMTEVAGQFENLTMQTMGLRLGTGGCDALAIASRQQAIEIAMERASILADALGMTLGKPTAVHESYQDLAPYGGAVCLDASGEIPQPSLANYGGDWATYVPDAALEIELTTTLEIVFEAE